MATYYRFTIKWRHKDIKYSKPRYEFSKLYRTYDEAEDAAFIAYRDDTYCSKRDFMGFHITSEAWDDALTLDELNELDEYDD